MEQNPMLSAGNPQNNQSEPRLPEPEQKNKGNGWGIGLFVLILIVLLVGVRLATWQSGKTTPLAGETDKEQLATVAETVGSPTPTADSSIPAESGEVKFMVSSPINVIVREIYLYNPFRAAAGEEPWILVYDGYRQVGSNPTEVFKVLLAPLTYEKVRVRALNAETGASTESIKEIRVEVKGGSASRVEVAL